MRELAGPESPPAVGMVGAGHFTRLTAQAAISLNVELRVFAQSWSDPAAAVSHGVLVGSSAQELADFAEHCDAVTFEHFGHPGVAQVAELERLTNVRPGSQALALIGGGWQDLLRARGIGVYDGDPGERRFAVLIARSPKGQGASYPVARLARHDGVWAEVVAPAPWLDPELAVSAQWTAFTLASEFGVTGLMTVEFVTAGAGILVTGVALGPHEAGLWTMDGSRTSQFSQLLQAVLDLPFGTTATNAAYTATVKITGGNEEDMYPRLTHVLAADPGVSVHLYDIRSGPGRRIGHVAVTGDDPDLVRDRAWRAANYIGFASEEPVNTSV